MGTSIVCLFFFLVNGILVTAASDNVFHGTNTLLLSDDPTPKKCRHTLAFGMMEAMCSNLNLGKIPSSVQKDIEVLEFSGNRLRNLKNDTLAPFTSLGYLYLVDSVILNIEEGAFLKLKKLQVLDLTRNGLNDFPKSIFALPIIKKIYLSENKLDDSVMDPTPYAIDSSLEFLDVSINSLTKVPRLGVLPRLTHLNLSGNAIRTIRTEDIAAFCSLKTLDLRNNPIIFTDSCECQALNAWVTARKIMMFPPKYNCSNDHENALRTSSCSIQSLNNIVSNDTLSIFESCKNVIRVQEQNIKARSTWILVGASVGSFLVCLFIILYCIHKRNKKKKKLAKAKKEIPIINANDELLNGNVSDRVE